MERKINIEEVRHFLEVADKQFVQGGVAILSARFKRNLDNSVEEIILSYDECEVESSEGKEAHND